jgi:biotin carboxyl carrier protein
MKRETLLSPLSGIINEIFIPTGSIVQVDQEILNIESMKLLYPVTSGLNGLLELIIAPGQFVQESQELGFITEV